MAAGCFLLILFCIVHPATSTRMQTPSMVPSKHSSNRSLNIAHSLQKIKLFDDELGLEPELPRLATRKKIRKDDEQMHDADSTVEDEPPQTSRALRSRAQNRGSHDDEDQKAPHIQKKLKSSQNVGTTSSRRVATEGQGSAATSHNMSVKPGIQGEEHDDADHHISISLDNLEPKTSKSKLQFHSEHDEIQKEAAQLAEEDHQQEVEVASEKEEDKDLIDQYNLGEPIKNWDQHRRAWAEAHPEVKQERLFILTGTQPWPCTNPEGDGDHLLLRCFKNKVDYSRIHGVGLFYNTALLDPHMPTFWAKLPAVRATMLGHPEVEWIWWVDADAVITDMEFDIPLERYDAYNLVVHGWESLIFEKKSWLGLNAGSFLLRNCQWSMDFMERWAAMGPKAPMGDAYRNILSDFLPDRPRNPTDDQAALVYLLVKEQRQWAGKLRVELDYFLSGYWLELKDGFEAMEEKYRGMEKEEEELVELLERHAGVGKEKMVERVGKARERRMEGVSVHERRSFITHFTGCQPCSGNHNSIYSSDDCRNGLVRALNYADDQVLRTLGYRHKALLLPDILPISTSTPSSSSRSTT